MSKKKKSTSSATPTYAELTSFLKISPPATNFSRCKFVTNEISHDLRSALSDNIAPQIYQYANNLAVFLDNPGCQTYTFGNQPVIHDYEILPIILKNFADTNKGYTRDYFLACGDLTNQRVRVVTINDDPPLHSPPNIPIDNSALTEARMCKFKMNVDKTFNDTLWNIFNPSTMALNNENIFFIIDTGSVLLRYLTKTKGPKLLKPAQINLHVITSVANIADSSSFTAPDAKEWTNEQYVDYDNQVKIYSWWYGQAMIVNNNNYFMSKYNINTRAIGPTWEAAQTWIDPALPALPVVPVYETLNAHIDNSKPKAIKSINKLAPFFNPHKPTNNAANSFLFPDDVPIMKVKKQELNLAFQKKRSGDYFQIISAKNFPTNASTPPATNFQLKRRNSIRNTSGTISEPTTLPIVWPPPPPPGAPPGNIAYYKRRTYFVTGDWPAFCYAIYLKINCIMVNTSSKYVISINFP